MGDHIFGKQNFLSSLNHGVPASRLLGGWTPWQPSPVEARDADGAPMRGQDDSSGQWWFCWRCWRQQHALRGKGYDWSQFAERSRLKHRLVLSSKSLQGSGPSSDCRSHYGRDAHTLVVALRFAAKVGDLDLHPLWTWPAGRSDQEDAGTLWCGTVSWGELGPSLFGEPCESSIVGGYNQLLRSDLLITQMEVTLPLKGSLNHPKKGSKELPGTGLFKTKLLYGIYRIKPWNEITDPSPFQKSSFAMEMKSGSPIAIANKTWNSHTNFFRNFNSCFWFPE